MKDQFTVTSIGFVESPVSEGVDEGWGDVESRIVLQPEFAPGLEGLDDFSHAVVVFYMHEASFQMERHLKRHPQGRQDFPELGIFAQRAKHRPNPIGITAVDIVNVDGNVLTVRGLDAVDGTPVLDIKPYVPQFDARPGCTVPEWIEELMRTYF